MRYPSDHKEKTRQRILDAAAVVFRRRGFQAGSVDEVMAEAGLTAGGFYAHFGSKEELFAEAFLQTLRQARTIHGKESGELEGAERVRSIVSRYLSPAHRQMIDQGCPMPPLLGDLPRQSEATRQSFEEIVLEIAASLQDHLGDDRPGERSDRALAILAVLIGGMSLARGVADEKLADRVLAACRSLIDSSLDPSPQGNAQKRRPKSTSPSSRRKGT